MRPPSDRSVSDQFDTSALLGAALTVLMMLAYFGFIGLGAFAPAVLATPVFKGGTTTLAFAYGLFVIALGVALTRFYVWFTNRQQA